MYNNGYYSAIVVMKQETHLPVLSDEVPKDLMYFKKCVKQPEIKAFQVDRKMNKKYNNQAV